MTAGIPLVSHAYAGNKPDVTQFATVIDKLTAKHAALAASLPPAANTPTRPEMTVVFDAGQNSADNFTHLAASQLHYVGSVPPSQVPDLLALSNKRRRIVDADRFEGLTALQTRREIYGVGWTGGWRLPTRRACTPSNRRGSTKPWARPPLV